MPRCFGLWAKNFGFPSGRPPVSFDSIFAVAFPFSVSGVLTPTATTRVLLVDDHPALLQQARRLLEDEFTVVGMLPDGSELVDAVARDEPDMIVLDITLPGASGLNLAHRLRETGSRARIIFLTVHCDADYARAAFLAGASGYVVKSRMASDLVPALRDARAGKHFVSPCPELEGVE
jgi:DNA-binding NarL/FixJ family response regulator